MRKSDEYLAGLFDGEGSFSIQVGLRQHKTRPPCIWFNPSLSVNLYYGSAVLEAFRARFGGHIYPGSRMGARWHLGQRGLAAAAATALQPYLEIKKDICRRFSQALSMFPARKGINVQRGERAWAPDVAVAVAEIALTLNPPRSRKSNKTLEYLIGFQAALGNGAHPWDGKPVYQTASGWGH